MLKKYIEKIKEKILKNLILERGLKFFIKDEFGNLIGLYDNDNYVYLMRYGIMSDSYPMMRALEKKVKGSGITIDVGANIGITTMWLARNSKEVHSFEPEKDNLKRIKENLDINKLQNVIVRPLAISNSSNDMILYIHQGKGHHSLAPIATTPILREERIGTTTIDTYCKERNINQVDVLKIDVEGFEKEVLEGAKEILAKRAIKLIVFEVSEFIIKRLNKEDSLPFIYNLLSKNNYSIYSLEGKKLQLNDFINLKQDDVYSVPDKK